MFKRQPALSSKRERHQIFLVTRAAESSALMKHSIINNLVSLVYKYCEAILIIVCSLDLVVENVAAVAGF